MSSPAALAAAESVVPAGDPPHYSREALVRLTALAIEAGWNGGVEAERAVTVAFLRAHKGELIPPAATAWALAADMIELGKHTESA